MVLMSRDQRLWMAVVNRAVMDLFNPNKKIRKEAYEWLFNENEDFEIVATLLDTNPNKFREKIKNLPSVKKSSILYKYND